MRANQIVPNFFATHIHYSNPTAPPEYVCSGCGATGCKLWRQYQTFLGHINLLCVDCAGTDQDKDVSGVDANGTIAFEDRWRIDQIGWLVPAVPTEEGDTFWGYGAVPQAGANWWRALPTRTTDST